MKRWWYREKDGKGSKDGGNMCIEVDFEYVSRRGGGGGWLYGDEGYRKVKDS